MSIVLEDDKQSIFEVHSKDIFDQLTNGSILVSLNSLRARKNSRGGPNRPERAGGPDETVKPTKLNLL